MFDKLLRMLGFSKVENNFERFEPVYGLPKQALEDWLSRNPSMRERYAADLARASKVRPRNYKEDYNDGSRQETPFDVRA